MDSHPKPFSNTHESYLQDTPHYLREVQKLNDSGKVRNSDILVTVDVSSLYTNIDQGEGLEAVKDALECSYKFLISLLNTNHIDNQHIYLLEFNGEHFIWLIGTAMRAVPAVRYAKN